MDKNHIRQKSIVESNYYPFGAKHTEPWLARKNQGFRDRYNYNGKEEMPFTGYLYYGARIYDPGIGRFSSVDPISDQFPHLSTFNYASNSPIVNIDLWGLQGIRFPSDDVNRMLNYFSTNSGAPNRDDCITCHNKGMRTLLNNNSVPVGSQADITRSKMQEAGYANETTSFGFTDANGNPSNGNASAENLESSVGATAENQADVGSGESSVFGVSIMDGYHTMTLTVSKTVLNGPTEDGTPLTASTFTLSDQGTRTTDNAGNKTFDSAEALDQHLENYMQGHQDQRTQGGYQFPSIIEIHQIKQPD